MKTLDMNSPNTNGVVESGDWRVVVSGTLSLSPGVSLECLHFMILTRGGSESEPGQAREGEE